MEELLGKEYTDFSVMYSDCLQIVKTIPNLDKIESDLAIKYIRKNIKKIQLNAYYHIGNITQVSADAIGSKTLKLKFSMDSLIKNNIEHPEISINEYLKISKYLNNADYILVKNEKNLIYFKIDGKIYQFVIKTTKNGLENFITTFHKASIKQLEKDIKRYTELKN